MENVNLKLDSGDIDAFVYKKSYNLLSLENHEDQTTAFHWAYNFKNASIDYRNNKYHGYAYVVFNCYYPKQSRLTNHYVK